MPHRPAPVRAIAPAFILTLAACGMWGDAAVSGTVTYRERMALTPNAEIQVSLLDVSVADAPAKVIVESTFTADNRQVPLPFSVSYDKGSISSRNTYVLRAEIRQDDHLLFTTDEAYPVINNGLTESIELTLIRAQPSALSPNATEALSGRLLLSAEVLRFVPCGAEGEGTVLQDGTDGDAAAIVRSLGGEGDGVTALVRLDGDRLVDVRYAGNEGPSCESLPTSAEVEARGNEPFWMVSVTTGVATFRSPEIEGIDYIGGSWVRPDSGGWLFAAERTVDGVTDSLTLDLREERCVDTMSGAHFPFVARATRAGQVFTGCAVEGRPAS